MNEQAFELLRDDLREIKEEVKDLRKSLAKLWIKIAFVAGAAGVLGGKFAGNIPVISQNISHLYKLFFS
jgi:hypothetical protein